SSVDLRHGIERCRLFHGIANSTPDRKRLNQTVERLLFVVRERVCRTYKIGGLLPLLAHQEIDIADVVERESLAPFIAYSLSQTERSVEAVESLLKFGCIYIDPAGVVERRCLA